MPDPSKVLRDPEFHALPEEDRRQVLESIDPDYKAMGLSAQLEVLKEALKTWGPKPKPVDPATAELARQGLGPAKQPGSGAPTLPGEKPPVDPSTLLPGRAKTGPALSMPGATGAIPALPAPKETLPEFPDTTQLGSGPGPANYAAGELAKQGYELRSTPGKPTLKAPVSADYDPWLAILDTGRDLIERNITNKQARAIDEPMVDLSKLLPTQEQSARINSQSAQIAVESARAMTDLASGLTTMENMMLGGTLKKVADFKKYAGPLAQTALQIGQVGLSTYFATKFGQASLDLAPKAREAYDAGDYPKAAYLITAGAGSALLAGAAAGHAVSGTLGVTDPIFRASERSSAGAARALSQEQQQGRNIVAADAVHSPYEYPVQTPDGQALAVRYIAADKAGRPYWGVFQEGAEKPIYGGTAGVVQRWMEQKGISGTGEVAGAPEREPTIRNLTDTRMQVDETLNQDTAQPNAGRVPWAPLDEAAIRWNEARAFGDRLPENMSPEARQAVLDQLDTTTRPKPTERASVPESGEPAEAARQADARERLSQQHFGVSFANLAQGQQRYIADLERAYIDEKVEQGYGAVQPEPAPRAGELVPEGPESSADIRGPSRTVADNPPADEKPTIPQEVISRVHDVILGLQVADEQLSRDGVEGHAGKEAQVAAALERLDAFRAKVIENGFTDEDVDKIIADAGGIPARFTTKKPQGISGTSGSSPLNPVKKERPPTVEPAYGKAVDVSIPGAAKKYPARYAVRELEDVFPSHNPETWLANPDYWHQNDRDYSEGDNQARVLENASDRFDPSQIIQDTTTATNGPTIIDQAGNALGGNNRAMTVARVYAHNPAGAEAYKARLAEMAPILGIKAEDLARFKRPVLTRERTSEVKSPPAEISDYNVKETAELTWHEQAVRDGKRITAAALDDIVSRLSDAGDEGTLADALRGEGGYSLAERLVKDGVFDRNELQKMADERGLTALGKDRIAKALVGRLFSSPKEMKGTPPEQLAKLERIAVHVARVEDRPEWAVTDLVRQAMTFNEELRARGGKQVAIAKKEGRATLDQLAAMRRLNPSVIPSLIVPETGEDGKRNKDAGHLTEQGKKIAEDLWRQVQEDELVEGQDSLDGRAATDPRVKLIARALRRSPTQTAAAFRDYANAAALSREGAQSAFFEPPSQAEAFNVSFSSPTADFMAFRGGPREPETFKEMLDQQIWIRFSGQGGWKPRYDETKYGRTVIPWHDYEPFPAHYRRTGTNPGVNKGGTSPSMMRVEDVLYDLNADGELREGAPVEEWLAAVMPEIEDMETSLRLKPINPEYPDLVFHGGPKGERLAQEAEKIVRAIHATAATFEPGKFPIMMARRDANAPALSPVAKRRLGGPAYRPGSPLQQQLAEARALNFSLSKDGYNILALNSQAMHVLLRSLGIDARGDEVGGWTLQADRLLGATFRMAGSEFRGLRDALVTAWGRAGGPWVLVLNVGGEWTDKQVTDNLNEEIDHALQTKAIEQNRDHHLSEDLFFASEEAQKALKALRERGYTQPADAMAIEIGARLMRPGRYEELGLTLDEAENLAELYASMLLATHQGQPVARIVKQVKSAQERNRNEQARISAESIADERGRTGRGEPQSGAPSARPKDEGRKGVPGRVSQAAWQLKIFAKRGRVKEFGGWTPESNLNLFSEEDEKLANETQAEYDARIKAAEDRAREMLKFGDKKETWDQPTLEGYEDVNGQGSLFARRKMAGNLPQLGLFPEMEEADGKDDSAGPVGPGNGGSREPGAGRSPISDPNAGRLPKRIVVAAEEFVKHKSPERIDASFRDILTPFQQQGLLAAYDSLRKNGGFLLADGTGAGKTPQILGLAKHIFQHQPDLSFVVISKAEVFKFNGNRPTGSYAAWLDKLDLPYLKIDARTAPAELRPGMVHLATFHQLGNIPVDDKTILVFDEAHALKNVGGSNRSQIGMEMAAQSKATLFATATPADKPHHVMYLEKMGIFEGQDPGDAMRALGLSPVEVRGKDGQARKEWRVNPHIGTEEATRRIDELFTRMIADGRMLRRELAFDGVEVEMKRVYLEPDTIAMLDKIEKAFPGDGLKKALRLMHQRRQMEPAKIKTAIAMAKWELAEGRKPIIFLGRINESKVIQKIPIRDSRGQIIDWLLKEITKSDGTAATLRDELKRIGITRIAEIHGNAEEIAEDEMARFQNGEADVLIATIESGGTGINLDDWLGTQPRSMIVMTAPFSAVDNVQMIGRVWRMSTQSHPRIVYIRANHATDDWNFDIIGKKMTTLGAAVKDEIGKVGFDGMKQTDWLFARRRMPDNQQSLFDAAELIGVNAGDDVQLNLFGPEPGAVEAGPVETPSRLEPRQSWADKMRAAADANEGRYILGQIEKAINALQRSVGVTPTVGDIEPNYSRGFSVVSPKTWVQAIAAVRKIDPDKADELRALVADAKEANGEPWDRLYHAEQTASHQEFEDYKASRSPILSALERDLDRVAAGESFGGNAGANMVGVGVFLDPANGEIRAMGNPQDIPAAIADDQGLAQYILRVHHPLIGSDGRIAGISHLEGPTLSPRAEKAMAEAIKQYNGTKAPKVSRPSNYIPDVPKATDLKPGTLTVISCGFEKAATAKAAKDLYTGPLFKQARAYAEATGEPWVILSAKWGFVRPDQIIEPYDVRFGKGHADEVPEATLATQVKNLGLNYSRVQVVGGKEYLDRAERAFGANGILAETPFRGLGIGQLLGALKEARQSIEKEAAKPAWQKAPERQPEEFPFQGPPPLDMGELQTYRAELADIGRQLRANSMVYRAPTDRQALKDGAQRQFDVLIKQWSATVSKIERAFNVEIAQATVRQVNAEAQAAELEKHFPARKAGGQGSLFARRKLPEAVEMHAGVPIPGVSKFVSEDVIPTAKDVAAALAGAADDILKVWMPATRSAAAGQAALIMRGRLAELARKYDRAEFAMRKARAFFRWRKALDNYDFINRMETGQAQATPEMDQIARVLRVLMDGRRDDVQALGKGKLQKFYEHYFPHIWKRNRKAEEIFATFYGRRPLEGGKSFLKQRKHPTFADGLAADLVPVSDNPVELVLLKLREMDRFVMAHLTLNDWKEAGLAKFIPVDRFGPKGWTKISDPIGTVYGSTTYVVTEYPNEGLYEGLSKVVQAMGLDHTRALKIKRRGAVGFAVRGTNKLVTKAGSAEQVLAHEIGHHIEFKWKFMDRLLHYPDANTDQRIRDLREDLKSPNKATRSQARKDLKKYDAIIQRRKKLKEELRAIADSRDDGSEAYRRSRDEKAAAVVEMWSLGGDILKHLAPTVWDEWVQFLDSKPELKELRDLAATMNLTGLAAAGKLDGLLIVGNWWAPEGASRILNNYLLPGLRSTSGVYRGLLGANNVLNQFQLGLSAFHLTMTSIDAMTSRVALALDQAVHGELKAAAINVATAPAAPITNIWRGDKLLKEWYTPSAPGSGMIRKVGQALVLGGGRARMDGHYQTQIAERMIEAFRRGNVIGAAVRLPFAVIEGLAKPILEWIVPRQKLGVFYDLASTEITRLGPNASLDDVRRIMAAAWDVVDDRMGQVVYDNYFWDRTARDLSHILVRSVGWNLGTFRVLLGGVGDMATEGVKAASGRRPKLTYRMAYLIAFPLVTAVLGALVQKLLTGEGPSELKDYFFPKTGEKDEQGRPRRIALPTYMKDALHYASEPGKTLLNKASPLISLVSEMLHNKDFFGTEIRDSDDPIMQQLLDVLAHVGKTMEPFGVREVQRASEQGLEGRSKVLPFFGLVPAPVALNESKAERLARELQRERLPAGARSQEQAEHSKLKRELGRSISRGEGIGSAAKAAVVGGELTPREALTAAKAGKQTSLQRSFNGLPIEDALKVWAVADDAERRQLRPMLGRKILGLKIKPRVERERLLPEALKAFRQSSQVRQ